MGDSSSFSIRTGTENDIPALVDILNSYIDNDVAIWLYNKVTVEEKLEWFKKSFTGVLKEEGIVCPCNCFLVCENKEDKQVIGYAYYTPFRSRAGWRFAKETSVYVRNNFHKRGIASMLYEKLIEHAKNNEIRSLIAGIGGENPNSVKLHKKFSFQLVGTFPQVGFKFEDTLDCHFYQLNLN